MVEALHLGALLPAAVGACCTVGGRRGIVDLVAAIVMLAAMIDAATGAALLHPLVWGAVLVAVGIVSAARLRGVGASSATAATADIGADTETPAAVATVTVTAERQHRLMLVHTSLGLLVMATMLVAMASHGSHAALGTPSSVTHHGAAGAGTFGVIVAAAVASYTAFTAWLTASAVRSRRILPAVELTSMALSLTAMAFALAV
ncbi:hypothetical protein [Plantibacter sp. YIM 135249]|uniref:hypothetical protein n=1 Tax=Plantibacter sp. YIM 135249 TaxID=3423918 RepID=UPI003D324E69